MNVEVIEELAKTVIERLGKENVDFRDFNTFEDFLEPLKRAANSNYSAYLHDIKEKAQELEALWCRTLENHLKVGDRVSFKRTYKNPEELYFDMQVTNITDSYVYVRGFYEETKVMPKFITEVNGMSRSEYISYQNARDAYIKK